ncbi:hypothetical protein Q361_1467 [Flavobacterium croceum DSM 17960]|uniref:Uncharacterized protein n=2 Tax=Flavobacterium TaxID=237 RepID=A0A2S4N4E0_9FLAO|nr:MULTISPECIES: hypothetical protein [Flavobacterium]NMH23839.1 hypothetical protein [Flavobacterium solisilvae]POS00609.1 hypothetical protein Q361_1467 [Flavobacterium croceum DSM 17960]
MKSNFLKPTLIFCLIAIFIPGLTGNLFFSLQNLTEKISLNCVNYWNLVWILTSFLAFTLPIIFIKNLMKTKNLTLTKLTLFNFIEYLCLQACLARIYIDAETLCYGTGEDGVEIYFTGWLALPIILCLSFLFKHLSKSF